MNTTIFYFSGTGNCLKIARDLAGELKDAKVVPIAVAIKEAGIKVSGRIGFVFPVYAFGVPLIVTDFINKLDIEKNAYLFAITSCAKVAGNTLNQLASQLKKRGSTLSAGFVIMMPNNYTPFGEALPVPLQERLFTEEARRVKEISSIVEASGAQRIEGSKLPLRLLGAFISCFSGKMMRGEDKNFRVTDACNGCGTCEKVCPVDNIEISGQHPRWMHRCEQCFACLQWCPQCAIQYGKGTEGRKRYHNPYIKLDELIY